MADEELQAYVLQQAAFHGAQAITKVKWGDTLDEEFVTGALFGAVASAFPLLAFIANIEPGHATTLYWSQFSKSKLKARDREHHSESKSGADFALLLCVAADDYRLAVFQAKRMKNKSITIHQEPRSPPEDNRATQLVTLWERMQSIWASVSHEPQGGADMSWTHYLAYGVEEMRCVPLSELRKSYETERDNEAASSVRVTLDHPTFANLVERGFNERQENSIVVDGWLCLSLAQALLEIPSLLSVTDLYLIDREVGGLVLTLELKNRPATGPGVTSVSVVERIVASEIKSFRRRVVLDETPASQAPGNSPGGSGGPSNRPR